MDSEAPDFDEPDLGEGFGPSTGPRITELYVRNYRSIADATIEFGDLTILVGRNGAGKSNVLDALAFLAEALSSSVATAMRNRGGFRAVRRRSGTNSKTHVTLAVRIRFEWGSARYFLKLVGGAKERGSDFEVAEERCATYDRDEREVGSFDTRPRHEPRWSLAYPAPAKVSGRLFLVAASGSPEFRDVFDVLSKMVFHNLNPDEMKAPQPPGSGERLAGDGKNLAAVVDQLETTSPDTLGFVCEALQSIGVPIDRIRHLSLKSVETVEVRMKPTPGCQGEEATSNPILLEAASLSDGTLRAMGIFLSLYASRSGPDAATLIGIEEPETALHPAALTALFGVLLQESRHTQLILTCHSPDLLADEWVQPEMVRAVFLEETQAGVTVVAPIAEEMIRLVRESLMTMGELLRQDQMLPTPKQVKWSKRNRNSFPLFAKRAATP